MIDYTGYMNITIPSGEEFDIDGVTVINNTDLDFHIFCKLVDSMETIDLTIKGDEDEG